MDGKRWSNDSINSPYSEEPPYATEVKLGMAGLRERQAFLYLFDYGDEWMFKVTLTSVTESDEPLTKPKLIKSVGEAPEQYPSWDDDEDEDDVSL
jgi:hypothetical protein